MIPVEIINKSSNYLLEYKTALAAGMDIAANENTVLGPGECIVVGTGLYIAIPEGYYISMLPRFGLAIKHGITLLNSPATIDADYRDEIKVILINHSKKTHEVSIGDRIAQIMIRKIEQLEWKEVEELNETERGGGGFGSTG